jgi:hypothetical protein
MRGMLSLVSLSAKHIGPAVTVIYTVSTRSSTTKGSAQGTSQTARARPAKATHQGHNCV